MTVFTERRRVFTLHNSYTDGDEFHYVFIIKALHQQRLLNITNDISPMIEYTHT